MNEEKAQKLALEAAMRVSERGRNAHELVIGVTRQGGTTVYKDEREALDAADPFTFLVDGALPEILRRIA